MLIPFGILSSAGSLAEGDFELIATEILTANTPSVTFSSLATHASNYKHLQIRAVGKTDRTAIALDFLALRFNGDTSTNYSTHELAGDGSLAFSIAQANETRILFRAFATDLTANLSGAGVVDILDAFSTSKFKTTRGLGGGAVSATFVALTSGNYRSLSAIDSISLTVGGGTNILTGSRFSLYGIRG